jgi:hypothetical protein
MESFESFERSKLSMIKIPSSSCLISQKGFESPTTFAWFLEHPETVFFGTLCNQQIKFSNSRNKSYFILCCRHFISTVWRSLIVLLWLPKRIRAVKINDIILILMFKQKKMSEGARWKKIFCIWMFNLPIQRSNLQAFGWCSPPHRPMEGSFWIYQHVLSTLLSVGPHHWHCVIKTRVLFTASRRILVPMTVSRIWHR